MRSRVAGRKSRRLTFYGRFDPGRAALPVMFAVLLSACNITVDGTGGGQSTVEFAKSNDITGYNLQVAGYANGRFERKEKNDWREISPAGQFALVELSRDETSVTLLDAPRDIYVLIDIAKREISSRTSNSEFRPLHAITGMSKDPVAAGTQSLESASDIRIATYNCIEGDTLTVRYETAEAKQFATISINNSASQRLPQQIDLPGKPFSDGIDTLWIEKTGVSVKTVNGKQRCFPV